MPPAAEPIDSSGPAPSMRPSAVNAAWAKSGDGSMAPAIASVAAANFTPPRIVLIFQPTMDCTPWSFVALFAPARKPRSGSQTDEGGLGRARPHQAGLACRETTARATKPALRWRGAYGPAAL